MRGQNREQRSMLMTGSLEARISPDHPIRRIKALADEALARLHDTFAAMYSESGRPSIPPERLLKAQILIALFTVRSDRMFCEQLNYNLLFRWFLDMEMDEAAFDASTFSKNRKRLIDNEIGQAFLASVVESASLRRIVSSDHFSVDGTLIEAWASMKSFKKKDDDGPSDSNGWSDFRGEKRSNETHESKTDPESRLARKGNGREAKLCFNASGLIENRSGLLIKLDAGICKWECRARRGDRPDSGSETREHVGRGSGLRHEGLCGADTRCRSDSACGPGRASQVRGGRPHNSSCGIRDLSDTKTPDRRLLRLDQDRRQFQADSIPRRSKNQPRCEPHSRCLQSCSNGSFDATEGDRVVIKGQPRRALGPDLSAYGSALRVDSGFRRNDGRRRLPIARPF